MKKFIIILIVLVVGFFMFKVGMVLLKIFAGLFVASLIGGGIYLGYHIGKNLSKGKI